MSLYTPYKAVGIVTDGKPFAVNQLGTETFLTVTIGSVFQVYRTDKLTVSLVGRQTPGAVNIAALAVCDKETFCAAGNKIFVYNRQRLVRTYVEHDQPILGLCMVGRTLVSWDESGSIRIIDTQKRSVVSEMQTLENSKISAVAHPATYINKFVFGYENGNLELWNIRKCKLVHRFGCHRDFFERRNNRAQTEINSDDEDFFRRNVFGVGGEHSDKQDRILTSPAVTALEQSPAVDVFGIGFNDGTILMVNLKLDKVLFAFKQQGGAVTTLSFRTDPTAADYPFMVSGGSDGRLHVWNLGAPAANQDDSSDSEGEGESESKSGKRSPKLVRKLQNTMEEAHRAAICSAHFLHGEPVLVTSAADNTIKMWIFDAPDGSARLLRSREGHIGHSNKIRYYGGDTAISMRENTTAESCEIISAGSDGTLRLFNTAIESQNREISQKPILRKLGLLRRNERLPIIEDFSFSETRQRDWGNLVTIHAHHANAYVWRYKHRVVTEIVLRQPQWPGDERMGSSDRQHHSTAVTVTPCGNFALIGSRGGVIYKYNLQSGLPRGSFPVNVAKGAIKKGTLDAYERKPGNVRHDYKKLMGGAVWTPLNASEPNAKEIRENTVEMAKKTFPERHSGEIRGLFVDTSNSVLVSCALDGNTIFWDLNKGSVLNCVESDTAHLLMVGMRDAGFAAVASQDRVIRVYDMTTYKLARRFDGHSREVSDLAFTPDACRLLSASADSTVRVWDMPTGRCLTWLRFGAPVLSLAVALSGESLSITQAGKDGIYTYVDRSLYEAVMFWKEPDAPIDVVDSEVVSTNAADESTGDEDVSNKEKLLEPGSRGGGELEEFESAPSEIKAPQAQVQTNQGQETVEQRAPGAITMSALPRGYWSTLFHLEAIKARNKPKAAPEKPKSAPFFLPTIFRGGSTSSFPTPEEFSKLQQNLDKQDMAIGESTSSVAVAVTPQAQGAKRATTEESKKNSHKKKKRNSSQAANAPDDEDEDAVMAELAGMGSAWNDEDDEDDERWGSTGGTPSAAIDQPKPSSRLTESRAADFRPMISSDVNEMNTNSTSEAEVPDDLSGKPFGQAGLSESRLISRRTVIPRCKLVAYLLKEFPDSALGTYASAEFFQSSTRKQKHMEVKKSISADADSVISISATLEYLKTLPPPAIDVEFRALCTHGEDEEGLKLLHCLLSWLAQRIASSLDFEVLEAYLHRTLLIYGEIIVTKPSLLAMTQEISRVHSAASMKLRDLVQGNLCLLKLLADLPPLQA